MSAYRDKPNHHPLPKGNQPGVWNLEGILLCVANRLERGLNQTSAQILPWVTGWVQGKDKGLPKLEAGVRIRESTGNAVLFLWEMTEPRAEGSRYPSKTEKAGHRISPGDSRERLVSP